MHSSFFKSTRRVSSHMRHRVVDFSNSPHNTSSDSTAEKYMIAGLNITASLVVVAAAATGIDARITLRKIGLEIERDRAARDKANLECATLKVPRI